MELVDGVTDGIEDGVVMDEFSTAGEGVALLIFSFDPGMQVSSVVVTGSWDALGCPGNVVNSRIHVGHFSE